MIYKNFIKIWPTNDKLVHYKQMILQFHCILQFCHLSISGYGFGEGVNYAGEESALQENMGLLVLVIILLVKKKRENR